MNRFWGSPNKRTPNRGWIAFIAGSFHVSFPAYGTTKLSSICLSPLKKKTHIFSSDRFLLKLTGHFLSKWKLFGPFTADLARRPANGARPCNRAQRSVARHQAPAEAHARHLRQELQGESPLLAAAAGRDRGVEKDHVTWPGARGIVRCTQMV